MPQKKYERHQMFFFFLELLFGENRGMGKFFPNIVLVSCALERGKARVIMTHGPERTFLVSPINQRCRFGQKQN